MAQFYLVITRVNFHRRKKISVQSRGRPSYYRMIVGFTATYAINAFHR